MIATTTLPNAPTSTRGGLAVTSLTVITKGRKTPIVEDVTFEVPQGTVLGLVGESGSGKSTASVALLGHARRGLEVAGGSVVVDGCDILSLDAGALREARGRLVSYVPQDPSSGLNPSLRIGTQLREALTIHRSALTDGESVDDRLRQVIEEVGLTPNDLLLRSYPHQLSGGQQQRVAIAMAFSCRPRLIVLDEPTTGLDVTTQRRVLDTVRRLTVLHQVTSVYVSHDLTVVAQIADQTAVMYAGRIVEIGATTSLFRTPRHHYTAGLIKAVPSATTSSVLVGIEGRPPSPGRWPKGCSFAGRCDAATEKCVEALPSLRVVGDRHSVRCVHPLPGDSLSLAKPTVPRVSDHTGAALDVHELSAHYGATEVLRGVELAVAPGQCTAVVGESGSGKTTLARCLVGLHRAWQGDARYGGDPLDPQPSRRSEKQRQLIQYVFQNPYASLNPRMSVGDNMDEPLRHFTDLRRDQRRDKVKAVLEAVALDGDFIDRMPDQLSGGERQRVAVGRALTVDPTLLVCDEVTSALDVSVQALLVEQLRELQHERGLSMLFITHNLAVVRSIAQSVVVLSAGRVVESGPTDAVLDHPRHAYTRQLLADLPRLEQGDGASPASLDPDRGTVPSQPPQTGVV